MAYVKLERLRKQFAGKPPAVAVDDVDLEVEQGEFLVLLGPSGCGKTTTLRCIAGLESPTAGSVALGGRTVYDSARRIDLRPDKRNVGMVFQTYALWPHMTVRQNIAYPLRARRMRARISEGWVEDTAALVDCSALLDRYPAQLSGGQQQRVALARGLVARPDLVLFDEPLSNLDARLRDRVRGELHELHERVGFTAVYVTHDQSEALALGDRMAIMRAGRVEQFDTPDRVFARPANEYVATFIGMANRLRFERRSGGWWCGDTKLPGATFAAAGMGDRIAVRLRPDDVRISRAATVADDEVTLPAHVVHAEFGGRHMDVVVLVVRTRVHARIPAGAVGSWQRSLAGGDRVGLAFRPADGIVFVDQATDDQAEDVSAADDGPGQVSTVDTFA